METETGLLVGFIVLLLIVFCTLIALLIHSGLFTPIDIKTCKPSIGDITVAYKFACGPYKESGALFTQCHTLLPKYKTIGVYYDDPKKKESYRLRYIVGLIVAENKDDTVDPEDKKLLEENGFKFAQFPAIDHAVETSFPINSPVSIIIAVMRVYPALSEYVESRSLCAHPFLEICNDDRKELLFIGPLVRQHDFYVQEILDDEEENRMDDDDDTVTERSWDESASIIHGDDLDKSESLADDSSVCGMSANEPNDFEGFKVPFAPNASNATAQTEDLKRGEDSDANTASSFEEIDEKEAENLPLDPSQSTPETMDNKPISVNAPKRDQDSCDKEEEVER